MKLTH
jgi:serine/threonine protein kinase